MSVKATCKDCYCHNCGRNEVHFTELRNGRYRMDCQACGWTIEFGSRNRRWMAAQTAQRRREKGH